MRVVGHNLGRLIVLFPQEEVRPVRGVPTAAAMASVRDRYNFLHMPDLARPVADLEQQGYQFSDGSFIHDDGEFKIGEFTIYGDGISVSSYVTETAELFFDDFIGWAMNEFQVRPFIHVPSRIYRSQITVCFAKPLSCILWGFDAFSKTLSTALNEHAGTSSSVDLVRIGVGIDELKDGGIGYVPFSLERRNQVPFEEEWYFSEAPLPSKTHLGLLGELETIMLDGR